MKTIPPPCPEPEFGPKYWRSLDQLADTPEFRDWVEREFPAGASELTDPVTRRHFVQIMSASFLLAGLGLTGCRRPEEKILPFAKAPENYVHGVPQFYATSMPTRGSAIPLVVKSNDGRPTKIEGNPSHPDSNGGTDTFAQASLLGLYDPDRATLFKHNDAKVSREAALDALAEISKAAQANGGAGLCFLLERSSSPSRERVQKLIAAKLPRAKWFVHEPVDFDIHRQGATEAFGKAVRPYYKLDAAKAILSLDCDFIGTEQDAYLNIRRFAAGRRVHKPEDSMNRLYVVEGVFSLTGTNADHRLRTPSSQVAAVAARLAVEILTHTGRTDLVAALQPLAAGAAKAGAKDTEKWITECAKDLLAHMGQAVVLAGQRQPLAVHLIAHAVNVALGAVGKTVDYLETADPAAGAIAELAKLLDGGQVETLVVLGGNPVYTAPADLGWAAAQGKAKNVVRVGYYEDESFAKNGWSLPLAHYLESWGDARTADGTLVPVQPLVEPLFGGVTELEVLARLGGLEQVKAYDVVRETFRGLGGAGEDAWKKFLYDGFLAGSASKSGAVTLNAAAVTGAISKFQLPAAPSKDKLEVTFVRSFQTDDGRFNNNGWLQETPDPITKLAWDNAIIISPKTAEELRVGDLDKKSRTPRTDRGLFHNQVVEVEVGGRKVSGPIWILPGMADNVLSLALGYGRTKTGRIGRLADGKPAGYNAYAVRATGGEQFAPGAKLKGTEARYQLASTQEHGAMEGRPVVREANKAQYDKVPNFARNMDLEGAAHTAHLLKDEKGNPKPIYPRPTYNGTHQWGMVVDLTSCVGCTACALACQSENNIPIVGKEQVTKGREMSWLRLDRYFAGDLFDPQVAVQPMFCQHCENAPCESVCPVNATVHDDEGLNLMAYNRCVGTRYCSNNCPYKVRRFNFFDYNRRPLDELYRSPFSKNKDGQIELLRWFNQPEKGTKPEDEWELLKLVRNPDVTVRMRGVMEKCTFCIQRIEQAKIAQKVKAGASNDVRVPDGADSKEPTALKTACQQACPAEAIVFGDISDPKSKVSAMKLVAHNYSVLGFLDTLPRVTYLARLRNPNPAMPDYHEHPLTLEEYEQKRHDNPFGTSGHGEGHGAGHGGKAGATAHPAKKGEH